MKYYIIAGEASGDLHASNLMKELKKKDGSAQFRCWGGDLMENAGGHIVKHYRDLAFMGFLEVVKNLRTILKNIDFCKEDINAYQPDAVILVDYPGFNLRIAPFVKSLGIKVIYYISPQVWAWKESRVKVIKKSVDKMLVILPFEKDFYRKWDFEVDFVGHPLIDAIKNRELTSEHFLEENNLGGNPIIALLPGSRKQEINSMLPVMMEMENRFPEYQLVVAGAPSVEDAFYEKLLAGTHIKLVKNQTYSLLENAKAAMVTSGTATLETALFQVPEVVCYKGGMVSYFIARRLVKVDYISLVNLVMKREVVKELIQDAFNAANLESELKKILENQSVLEKMKTDYLELREKLGGTGASDLAAGKVLEELGFKG